MQTTTETVTFKGGYGYWDVTDYGYGGCFRRAANDFEVELTNEHIKSDLKFYFTGPKGEKRTGFSTPQAFSNWKSAFED